MPVAVFAIKCLESRRGRWYATHLSDWKASWSNTTVLLCSEVPKGKLGVGLINTRDTEPNIHNIPNISVGIIPILPDHAENSITIEACRPRVQNRELTRVS